MDRDHRRVPRRQYVLWIATFAVTFGAVGTSAAGDLNRPNLAGTWKVLRFDIANTETVVRVAEVRNVIVTEAGITIEWLNSRGKICEQYQYTLDERSKITLEPAQDVGEIPGSSEKTTYKGMFRLAGEEMELCFGRVCPASFEPARVKDPVLETDQVFYLKLRKRRQ